MVYDKDYRYLYKEKERLVDKELGPRYRSDEALQGESYSNFKNRIIKDEIKSIREKARTVYPAWIKMPEESMEDFKKRLTAIKIGYIEKLPAWKRGPDESEEDFKKRFTSIPK